MEKNSSELLTELGTEAVLNYERITALYYLLEDKGIISSDEFDAKFKNIHQHYADHIRTIFGDKLETD